MVTKRTKTISAKKNRPMRRRINFKYDAVDAQQVNIAGNFNEWSETSHSMKKGNDGVWEKVVMLPEGFYEYKFVVDGIWINDPANKDTCTNEFGTTNNRIKIS